MAKIPSLAIPSLDLGTNLSLPSLDIPQTAATLGMEDGVDLTGVEVDLGDGRDYDGVPFEAAAAEEMGETLTRMRAISMNAADRFKNNTDMDYFVAVVFLNQVQKDEFMKMSGWSVFSNGGRYVNGLALAEDMEINLPPVDYKPFEPK